MELSLDVLRQVVSRVPLWHARRLQKAHPTLAWAVNEVVDDTVRRSMAQPRPACLDAFMGCSKHTEEKHGNFVFLQEANYGIVVYDDGEVRVSLKMYSRHARTVLGEVVPLMPGFKALETAVTVLWWLWSCYTEHVPHPITISTMAPRHCPTSEVLNCVVAKFVATHCPSAPWNSVGGGEWGRQ